MAGPGRIAGIAALYVDGVAVNAKGSLEWKPTSTKREEIVDMAGDFVGYSEVGDPPYMSATLLDTGAFKVVDMFNNTNIQVIAQLANGKTVTGSSMTVMEGIPVKNEDATFDVKWVGKSVVEALPQVTTNG